MMCPFQVLRLLFLVSPCLSIIGFDCAHPQINITTIATDTVPGCKTNPDSNKPVSEIIQLVQIADKYPIHVYQCKIKVLRTITHCGMHSHSSAVKGGVAEYLVRTSHHECIQLHNTRSYQLGQTFLTDLTANNSHTRQITMAGKIGYDGSCKGTEYSDMFGSWSDVVVQGSVTIVVNDYTAYADTTNDKVTLRSGISCTTSQGSCMDIENGFTTWVVDALTKCDQRKHMVLYEGASNSYEQFSNDTGKTKTYIVENKDKVFGLRTISYYTGCMFKAYTTEHPKLIIIPKTVQGFYFTKHSLNPSSMDLMAYVNSKFVYVEKAVNRNIQDLYNILSAQRCSLERRTLQTLLSLSTINPQEFAFAYMNSPGYTALKLGEVIHLIKCVAVDVIIRPTDRCFHELPIHYHNKSLFLTPKSRLLQNHGTEVDCDNIINAQFRLDDTWYAIGKSRHPVPSPVELTPQPVEHWKPKSMVELAKSGIYSYEESELLRERVMNPYEREAINNIITRGVSGKDIDIQDISLTRLVDDEMIDNMGEKITTKLWGYFSIFGNISSGCIGLYFIFRLFKFGLDTLIHCSALYDVYGLSVALIGGIWDSVTHYLLHRKRHYKNPGTTESPEDIVVEKTIEPRNESVPPVGSAPPMEHAQRGIYPNLSSYSNYQ